MRELCVVPVPASGQDVDEAGSAASISGAPPLGPLQLPLPERENDDFDIPKIIAEKIRTQSFFWSAEFIPGTTPQLQALLDQSLKEICNAAYGTPTFVSVTWHQSHLREKEIDGLRQLHHPALELSRYFQANLGIPALLHISSGNLKQTQVVSLLESCIDYGIKNLLVLRGDQSVNDDREFCHASDLVHFIRKVFGSKFKIGVAGYPMGHPESLSLELDLLYLKKKVDEGADFVLTQMVSSLNEFVVFCEHCNSLGINVPIIPGLYLIQSFESFQKFISTCHIKVPTSLYEDLKMIRNIEREEEYGLRIFQDLLTSLRESSCCPGVHIFTINRVSRILNSLQHEDLKKGTLL